MKKLMILVIAAVMMTGCEATKKRTARRTPEAKRLDSIVEYRRTHQHKYSTYYSVVKMYRMHEPDCPLCKEMRRKEIIAIVDSMLREKEAKFY